VTDIVAFISARLDEDEAYALEAAKEFGPDWIEIWSGQIDLSANLPDRQPPADRSWDAHVQTNDSRVSRHMVRHDPARVLREVAAKRRVLERHGGEDHMCVKGIVGYSVQAWYDKDEACPDLLNLAAPYADHPDYDPEWRAEA
jgi:uncharacterized protein DUF6221